MPGRKIRDEADARACLSAAQNSGATRTAWAHAHGVDARSLQAWRLIIERKNKPATVEFFEVVPAKSTSQRLLRVGNDALFVDVPHEFDEDHLRRVLRVVASC